jgi:membrane fusion protein, multidrug efflux system
MSMGSNTGMRRARHLRGFLRLEIFMAAQGSCRSSRRLVVLCAALAGCAAQAEDKSQPSAKAGPMLATAERGHAAAAVPARADGAAELQLAGDLRPTESAELAFKIAGQLVAVKVERGQRVKRGQLLAALAESEARAQFAQTEAAVAQAKAQLALARDSEARAASLVAANAASNSQAIAAKLQAETAQAALLQAEAARDLAGATLINHQLKAPFDGEIVRVPDGVGGIVAPGTALFRLESLDQLVLRTTVSEAELDRVKVGDEVVIASHNGTPVSGKVKVVLRSLEAQSRRAPIEVSVPNKDRKLIAGSYVRATLKPR